MMSEVGGASSVSRAMMNFAEGCMLGAEAGVARIAVESESARAASAREESRSHESAADAAAAKEVASMRERADSVLGWSLSGAALEATSGACDIRAATMTGQAAGVWRGIAESTKAGATASSAGAQRSGALGDAQMIVFRNEKEASDRAARRADDEARTADEAVARAFEFIKQTNAARLESQRAAIRG